MNNRIKLLHNQQIDTGRWDQVITGSLNSRIYALSWFLDILNPDWHGIVVDDYAYVMPVVISKKWGIKYAYQPTFAQQHGVFPPAPPEVMTSIFSTLEKQFRFIDITLNSFNLVDLKNGETEERKNFLLSLKKNYEDIFKSYTNGGKNNLKKAVKLNTVISNIPVEDFLKIAHKTKDFSGANNLFSKFKLITTQALSKGVAEIYGAYSEHNELTGAALFLKEGNRYVYLSSCSTAEGKKNNSMFSILDTFIHDHAGQPYLLDFEGSNIPGIAYFFSCFGAKPETYLHIKINRLPWPLKFLKR